MGILLHKQATVPFDLIIAVHNECSTFITILASDFEILKELITLAMTHHSTARKNLMKLQEPETGPSQGGRAWS